MKKNSEELAKSVEDLRAEVKELREMVNMLVDMVMNLEQDDLPEYEPDFLDFSPVNKDHRFSM